MATILDGAESSLGQHCSKSEIQTPQSLLMLFPVW